MADECELVCHFFMHKTWQCMCKKMTCKYIFMYKLKKSDTCDKVTKIVRNTPCNPSMDSIFVPRYNTFTN